MYTEQAPPRGGGGHAGGVCTLTFDDGPDPSWTPRVLAELDHCDVQSTFFVVGERLAEDPGPARAVLAAGHEVELHCHRHLRHTELSEAELDADTSAALEEFERAGLRRPRYWRTPWGVRSAATAKVAARHRLRLVDWTIDTHDWRGDRCATMLEKAGAQLVDGAIVLMHDGLGPGARRSGVEATVTLIGPLAALARARGLRPVPVSLAQSSGLPHTGGSEAAAAGDGAAGGVESAVLEATA